MTALVERGRDGHWFAEGDVLALPASITAKQLKERLKEIKREFWAHSAPLAFEDPDICADEVSYVFYEIQVTESILKKMAVERG